MSEQRAPLHRHIDADDVGAAAAYLLSDPVYALAAARYERGDGGGSATEKRAYYFAAGVTCLVGWGALVAIGVLAGRVLPAAVALAVAGMASTTKAAAPTSPAAPRHAAGDYLRPLSTLTLTECDELAQNVITQSPWLRCERGVGKSGFRRKGGDRHADPMCHC